MLTPKNARKSIDPIIGIIRSKNITAILATNIPSPCLLWNWQDLLLGFSMAGKINARLRYAIADSIFSSSGVFGVAGLFSISCGAGVSTGVCWFVFSSFIIEDFYEIILHL